MTNTVHAVIIYMFTIVISVLFSFFVLYGFVRSIDFLNVVFWLSRAVISNSNANDTTSRPRHYRQSCPQIWCTRTSGVQ